MTNPVAIFLLVLVIILMAPLLFSRIRVPSIVGMIVAGMVCGPHALGWLDYDASFEIFGRVGILYLMFLAAIEIDMQGLRRYWLSSLGFGLLSFTIPFASGVALSVWGFGTGTATALLVGCIFGSHTLISYPIIRRFGLSGARPVVVSVCGTVVAVLLTLLVLAEIVDVCQVGRFMPYSLFRLIGSTVVYGIVIGFVYPPMTRWFFRHYSEPVTQFVYILALVLLASLLAQIIGLEGILGAFYSGLILNRFIPGRSALMNRLEFVGNAVFIPYFLIGVGMQIDVRVVFTGWGTLKIAVVMSLVALLSKLLASWLTRNTLRLDFTGGSIMFGLTAGKAAATIATVMIGLRYSLLSEQLMNGAVFMILVCCLIASIATEQGARRLRLAWTEEDQRGAPTRKRVFARQLVAVANPVTAAEITNLAILMRAPANPHPMTALFVRNSDENYVRAMGKQALQCAVGCGVGADVKTEEIERFDTNVAAAMVNVMRERDCTDLVIGMHRRSSVIDTFYGSLIEQILKRSNRMVTMSRCMMPVDTCRRIYVLVPDKARFETGFVMWVDRVGNLAVQLGSPVEFLCFGDAGPYIKGVFEDRKLDVRASFKVLEEWGDFITASARISQEDLLIVIGARRTSVSFSSDLESLPDFLSRYFADRNLIVVYPEQFGSNPEMPMPLDTLSSTYSTNPSPWLLLPSRLRLWFTRHSSHPAD